MIKFKNILVEVVRYNNYEVKKPYIRIFKALFNHGLKKDDYNGVFKFITDRIGIEDRETASIITVLYDKNFKPDGDFDGVKDTQWVIPSDYEKDEWGRALGYYFDVSPFMFETLISRTKYYKPLIELYQGNTNTPTKLISNVQIFRYEEIVNEARRRIHNRIDEEGWEYFDSGFLEKYIDVNMDTAEYNAEQRVEEEWDNFLNKKESLKLSTKEGMIEDIGLVDEYFEWKEEIEYYRNDIKELKKEKQTLEYKSEKVYREMSNISLNIETLSDTVDYGDDEQEYYSMYDSDIDDLSSKLNRLESIYEEINSDIDYIDTQINELTAHHDDLYLDFEIYDNDNKFKSLYKERRMEQILADIEDDPLQYIWDSGLDIDGALREDLITLDEDLAIKEAVESDGPAYFLDLDDYYTDEFGYQDNYYFIIINVE